MSVQLKILVACLGFVAIIATVGGLAQRQAAEMGRLAIGIYDHAFMGMSYVDQAQQAFLRLEAAQQETTAALKGSAELEKVLQLLDVALDRVESARTREAGKQTRALLASLADAQATALAGQMRQADRSLTKLVKKFSADGLETRDDAEELAAHSTRLVLIQIGVAVALALGVGFLVGRNLSRPLVTLVRAIERLAAGELDHEVPRRLAARRDEIGAVARAASVFREAMQLNAQAAGEQERQRQHTEAEKQTALRRAADSIERETTHVAAQSMQSGSVLSSRAAELAASAARMLVSVQSVDSASQEALNSCQVVAAAGEQLSASAREIASQLTISAAEITSTARAGEKARGIIDTLSASVGQINAVVHLIGDIAERTNLLALNATIEAARAGDAGRGFAVVANEVKALASQTTKSTEDIARTIGSIQAATGDAVNVVGEIVRRVIAIEEITQVIGNAAEQQTAATGEIARSVLGTVDAMRVVSAQIASVSEEARGTDAAISEMQSVAGTVADQIAELRSVMVRVVRTSSSAANRREDERFPLNATAMLLLSGEVVPVTCVNLSLGGARVRAEQPLPTQARVMLRVAGLPDMAGQILQGGLETGIRFAWQADAAPQPLRDWLAAAAAAA